MTLTLVAVVVAFSLGMALGAMWVILFWRQAQIDHDMAHQYPGQGQAHARDHHHLLRYSDYPRSTEANPHA